MGTGLLAAGSVPTLASAEARLELLEFLIGSVDLERSGRHGLEWLAAHAGISWALCGMVHPEARRLVWIADYGLAAGWQGDRPVDLDQPDHPIVDLLTAGEPVHVTEASSLWWAPAGPAPAHVLPLRPAEAGPLGDGLLLVSAGPGGLHPELAWFVQVFGDHLGRLRSRQVLAGTRFGRERRLLLTTLNAVSDPILLTDADGRLIIANAPAEQLFTAPPEATEGRRQAVALNNMLFSAALSSGALATGEPSRRELPLADPIDGSDLLFELLSSVVKDEQATSTFVVSVLRNVTDLGLATAEIRESQRQLRLAQAEMREQRHRLELIIDSVPDPILVTDAAGDIVLFNSPADKLFITRAGREQQRRVETNGARFSSFVANVLTGGRGQRFRSHISLMDPESGESKPVEAVAGAVLSETGELVWVVTILHDRTEEVERARLYSQLKVASAELEGRVAAATAELARQNELLRRQALELEQASALKSQFLANMSHEFRTPLNAILGYTQILLKGVAGELNEGQRTSLSRIDSNSRHLMALINDILDITRIEAGRMPVRVNRFRLPELIGEVLAELEPIIVRSKVTLRAELGPRLPAIATDRAKVKQIVSNLLSNALKFTPHGSVWIRVTRDRRRERLAIAVEDTGVGIAPADRDRVFDDFRQLDSSASRGYGGTGLGLSICRRLAEVLGGEITLRSEPGKGSTFTLHLPVRLTSR